MLGACSQRALLYHILRYSISSNKPQQKCLLSTKKTSHKRARSDDDETSEACTGCGRTNYVKSACLFTSAKYFNTGSGKYSDSTAYQLLIKDRPNHKDKTCPRDSMAKSASSVSFTTSQSASATASQKEVTFKSNKSKSSVSV